MSHIRLNENAAAAGRKTIRQMQIFVDCDDKFFLLIGSNGDPHFRKLIQAEATEKFKTLFKIPNAEIGDHIMAYLTSALLGTLTYWHETGKKISVIELGNIIHGLATEGVPGLTQMIEE